MNITLDTNCIIGLEQAGNTAPYIRSLMCMYEDRKINLRVVAISASERKPDGKYASNFAEFKEEITAVGLGHVEILRPIAYFNITFFDWCRFADSHMVELERKIHEILFPKIEFAYEKFCRSHSLDPNSGEIDRRWRNAKCDVLALWSHIYYRGDIFLTTDKNFHKRTKKGALIALGVGDILTPKDVVARLTSNSKTVWQGLFGSLCFAQMLCTS